MGRTGTLPTLEDDEIPEISEKAEEYDKAKNSRLKALGKEVVLKEELINLMRKHKKTTYRDGDLIVEIKAGKEGIKVKHESEKDED